MEIEFTESAHKDYQWWKKNDQKKAERIAKLCKDIQVRPFKGIGKPEPLKFGLQGCWSRRIDKTNRLVSMVERKTVTVVSCRYHY